MNKTAVGDLMAIFLNQQAHKFRNLWRQPDK